MAVVCLESVDNEAERRHLAARLGKTHTIVDITRAQVREPGWRERAPSLSLGSLAGSAASVARIQLALPGPAALALPVAAASCRHLCPRPARVQMAALCGNVLELEDGRGLPVLAMSTRAYNAFTEDQKRVLRWVGGGGG